MRKHSSIAFFLIAFVNVGAPAWADVSGTLFQWTATSKIEQLENGDVKASVKFDDNGTGGTRNGGVALVTNLGLGNCETQEQCGERAVARGLPGATSGPPGWFHYCVAAGTDEGVPHNNKRCWTRPGFLGWGTNALIGPGSVLQVTMSPYGIPAGGIAFDGTVVGHPERQLENEKREWSALACLGSGSAPNGDPVGVPSACRLQIEGSHIYVVDTPIEVNKGH